MNLSPGWAVALQSKGYQAAHWSSIGNPAATDQTIMDWARKNGYIIFIHDLDFGILLALTRERGPSVIQIRAEDIMPDTLEDRLISVMNLYSSQLEKGALLTIDPSRSRIKILPIL